jgi:hypothetical protein
MANSLTYDPSQVTVTFLGANIHGFIDGSFVKAERDEDAFFKQVGADGEWARAKNKNKGGKVTFILQQTSVSNDTMATAAKLDELGNGGHGALIIKDLNGTTLLNSKEAWVQKMAPLDLAKELGQREWVLDTGELDIFVGGNAL